MKTLRIGRVAEGAGIGIETVRYYEREGLIEEPPRYDSSGYRQYPVETVSRLQFIRKAKSLGFSLKEIGELLSLKASPSGCCGIVRSRATEKIEDIDERIEVLQAMRGALAGECSGEGRRSKCPILGALEVESDLLL